MSARVLESMERQIAVDEGLWFSQSYEDRRWFEKRTGVFVSRYSNKSSAPGQISSHSRTRITLPSSLESCASLLRIVNWFLKDLIAGPRMKIRNYA